MTTDQISKLPKILYNSLNPAGRILLVVAAAIGVISSVIYDTAEYLTEMSAPAIKIGALIDKCPSFVRKVLTPIKKCLNVIINIVLGLGAAVIALSAAALGACVYARHCVKKAFISFVYRLYIEAKDASQKGHEMGQLIGANPTASNMMKVLFGKNWKSDAKEIYTSFKNSCVELSVKAKKTLRAFTTDTTDSFQNISLKAQGALNSLKDGFASISLKAQDLLSSFNEKMSTTSFFKRSYSASSHHSGETKGSTAEAVPVRVTLTPVQAWAEETCCKNNEMHSISLSPIIAKKLLLG